MRAIIQLSLTILLQLSERIGSTPSHQRLQTRRLLAGPSVIRPYSMNKMRTISRLVKPRTNIKTSFKSLSPIHAFDVLTMDEGLGDSSEFSIDDLSTLTALIDSNKVVEAVERCLGAMGLKCVDSNTWAVVDMGYTSHGRHFDNYLRFAQEMYRMRPDGSQWSSVLFSLMSGLKKRNELFGHAFVVKMADWLYSINQDGRRSNPRIENHLRLFTQYQIPKALKHFCDLRNVGFRLCSPKGNVVLNYTAVNSVQPVNVKNNKQTAMQLWTRQPGTRFILSQNTTNANDYLNCPGWDCGQDRFQIDLSVGGHTTYQWGAFAMGFQETHIAISDHLNNWFSLREDIEGRPNNKPYPIISSKTLDKAHTLLICNTNEPLKW